MRKRTPKRQPQIELISMTGTRLPKAFIRRLCLELFHKFKDKPVLQKAHPSHFEIKDLTLAFVSSAKIRKLNAQYRRKNYATDILSFSPQAPGQGLGELVLCEPILKRQARENGHSFKDEIGYMIIHGFLHLLGYEHETNRKEELKMMKLQDRLFDELKDI